VVSLFASVETLSGDEEVAEERRRSWASRLAAAEDRSMEEGRRGVLGPEEGDREGASALLVLFVLGSSSWTVDVVEKV